MHLLNKATHLSMIKEMTLTAKNSLLFVGTVILFSISSCNSEKEAIEAPLQEIPVVKVTQKDVPIREEFVGQIYGLKDIPIRARVEGFLEGMHFNEGSRVTKGQALYSIDQEPFMANVAAKESDLASAKTLLVNAENELERYKPLAEINAVSQSDLDAAQASRDAAVASVDAAEANLELAKINMSYTQIFSPIQGVIGKTMAREGEFVGKDPNPVILNTVSRIDTMRVRFYLTESQYLFLAKAVVERGESKEDKDATVQLLLSDGTMYDELGTIAFVDRNIDAMTGSMLVEAHFPNSKKLLRPGMYARIVIEMATAEGAILIPQRCVVEIQGKHSVYVVNDSNVVESRQVVMGEKFGEYWIVREGLKANETIVIDALQKVRSGVTVSPKITPFKPQIIHE